jgi:hypothetical protein
MDEDRTAINPYRGWEGYHPQERGGIVPLHLGFNRPATPMLAEFPDATPEDTSSGGMSFPAIPRK